MNRLFKIGEQFLKSIALVADLVCPFLIAIDSPAKFTILAGFVQLDMVIHTDDRTYNFLPMSPPASFHGGKKSVDCLLPIDCC